MTAQKEMFRDVVKAAMEAELDGSAARVQYGAELPKWILEEDSEGPVGEIDIKVPRD